jgi:hypothetical protein
VFTFCAAIPLAVVVLLFASLYSFPFIFKKFQEPEHDSERETLTGGMPNVYYQNPQQQQSYSPNVVVYQNQYPQQQNQHNIQY